MKHLKIQIRRSHQQRELTSDTFGDLKGRVQICNACHGDLSLRTGLSGANDLRVFSACCILQGGQTILKREPHKMFNELDQR